MMDRYEKISGDATTVGTNKCIHCGADLNDAICER